MAINVNAGGELTTWRGTVLEGQAANRLAVLVDISAVRGGSASLIGTADEFRNDAWVGGDHSAPRAVELSSPEASRRVDLSTADRSSSPNQHEVFHNRGVPDLVQLACRVLDNLGDEFDFMVFHNEFEVDSQEAGSPVSPYAGIPGTGAFEREFPCGQGRLKALLQRPISTHTFYAPDLDNVLGQVAHEFGHVWSAYLSVLQGGTPGIAGRRHLQVPLAFRVAHASAVSSAWPARSRFTHVEFASWKGGWGRVLVRERRRYENESISCAAWRDWSRSPGRIRS